MAVLISCNQFRRIFSLLQVKICSCEPLILKCGYARGKGGGRRKKGQLTLPHDLKLSEIRDEPQIHGSLFIDPDDGEKSQSIDDVCNIFNDQRSPIADLHKFAKKEREKLKLKILKRKYFKDPQETNLLTWETKQQICFLNREFPEDWTVDRLVQSFPVSRNGIIKLLKSSYVIKTPEKILEHDLKVKQRWKELEADLSRKGGPVNLQYKILIESGKLNLMKNAATLKGAPKEVLKLEDGMKTRTEEVGVFSSIVKDYTGHKIKKAADEKLTLADEFALKRVVEAISVWQGNANGVPGTPSDRTARETKSFSTQENPTTELNKIPRSMRRKLKGEEISVDNLSYLEAYQMMGTGKVSRSESVDTNKKENENVFTERETRKYFKYPVRQYYSQPSNVKNFNEMSHQSWDPSLQTHIKIPEHLKNKKGVVYKNDDTYYDENGEILFRVPFKE